jgi:hypothetical protein
MDACRKDAKDSTKKTTSGIFLCDLCAFAADVMFT